MSMDGKIILVTGARLVIMEAMIDSPWMIPSLELLLETSIPIEQFNTIADLTEDIWTPEFTMN